MPSGGKRRPSVASRYLAAIECSAAPPAAAAERVLSPPTTPFKEMDTDDSYGSAITPIQTRSTGNSPSSSRRSRASRTPPRDGADTLRSSSFFPATSSSLKQSSPQHQQQQQEAHDTDESSLTRSSRSSTPPLIEEVDDEAATLLRETRDRIHAKLRRSVDPDWRSRMDGTANYKGRKSNSWMKKKPPPIQHSPRASPPRPRASPTGGLRSSPTGLRSSPVSTNSSALRASPTSTSAPTEVMTNNLSSKRKQLADNMTDTSTEIITNRTRDLQLKFLEHTGGDVNDVVQDRQYGPQHVPIQRPKWPPAPNSRLSSPLKPAPTRRPVDVPSLLSTSSNEESTRSSFQRHAGGASIGSFHDQSLSSSVGVETGMHTVSKSTPALKRVFEINGYNRPTVLRATETDVSPQQEQLTAKAAPAPSPDVILSRLRGLPVDEPDEQQQQESLPTTSTVNPFQVRYTLTTEPARPRGGLYDTQDASAASSSAGWTPVPLSSSGMEDVVFNDNVTPMSKNSIAQQAQPLFSADRVPSTSKSPFSKLYRPEDSSTSGSEQVGAPPDILRITAQRPQSVPEEESPQRESPRRRRHQWPPPQAAAEEEISPPADLMAIRQEQSTEQQQQDSFLVNRTLFPSTTPKTAGSPIKQSTSPRNPVSPTRQSTSPKKSISPTRQNVPLEWASRLKKGRRVIDQTEKVDKTAKVGVPSEWSSRIKLGRGSEQADGEKLGRTSPSRSPRDDNKKVGGTSPSKSHAMRQPKHVEPHDDQSPRKAATNDGRPQWASRIQDSRRIQAFEQKLSMTDERKARAFNGEGEQAEETRDTTPSYKSPKSSLVQERIRALSGGSSDVSGGKKREVKISRPVHHMQSLVDTMSPVSSVCASLPSGGGVHHVELEPIGESEPTRRVPFPTKGAAGQPDRSPVTARFLNAITAKAGALGATPPGIEGGSADSSMDKDISKTPRKSLVIGAHLAATVDDVSPQERYRMHWRGTDDTLATDESREVSDVNSLRSLFESSRASGPSQFGSVPSDESSIDDDDRTVESIRSRFEPQLEEEPSAVSKMRAIFESSKNASSGKGFSGNSSVTDAFSKFESSGGLRAQSKQGRRSLNTLKGKHVFASPDDARAAPETEAVTKSAPAKLSAQANVASSADLVASSGISEESKHNPSAVEVDNGAIPSRSKDEAINLQVMSVAERIRALKSRHRSETHLITEEVGKVHIAPKQAVASAQLSQERKVGKASETVGLEQKLPGKDPSQRAGPATENIEPESDSKSAADSNEKEEPKRRGSNTPVKDAKPNPSEEDGHAAKTPRKRGGAYPSISDRINAFSGASELNGVYAARRSPTNAVARRSPTNVAARRSPTGNVQSWMDRDKSQSQAAVAFQKSVPGTRSDEKRISQQERFKESPQRRNFTPIAADAEKKEKSSPRKEHGKKSSDSGNRSESTKSGMVITKKPLQSEGGRVSSDAASPTESEVDDGVTLDLSIADISGLTNPTCLRSKEDGDMDSFSVDDDSSHETSDEEEGGDNNEQEGKGPSEASSSQMSEAAVPLISRIRFSDDPSVKSDRGAKGRSGPSKPKWEPLSPSTGMDDADAKDGEDPKNTSHESAWSPVDIDASFPLRESQLGDAFAPGDKLWQPFQTDNWENSVSFASTWTPPTKSSALKKTTKQDTPGQHAKIAPVRRNTAATDASNSPKQVSPSGSEGKAATSALPRRRRSPRQGRPTPERKLSPTKRLVYRRAQAVGLNKGRESETTATSGSALHRADRENVEAAARSSPVSGALSPRPSKPTVNPRSSLTLSPEATTPSPTKALVNPRPSPPRSPETSMVNESAPNLHGSPQNMNTPAVPRGSPVSGSSGPSTSSTVSKHILLMKKLRSLKEARMKRNAAAGFNRNSVYPERPRQRLPPTSSSRASPTTTSALAPFLRPNFVATRQARPATNNQYPEAKRPANSHPGGDDELSASTKSSTRFGGHMFVDSLEVD